MDFEEYRHKYSCRPLSETEQSKTFLVEKKNKEITVVCKKFPSVEDRCREEMAYSFISSRHLLSVPEVFYVGKDFIELEYIEQNGDLSLKDIVFNISRLYLSTLGQNSGKRYFNIRDLSKQKLMERIFYLGEESNPFGLKTDSLLKQAKDFVDNEYQIKGLSCLVHGDLKSPHILSRDGKNYFIDLGEMSIADPWYDLSFLCMENANDKDYILNLNNIITSIMGKDLGISQDDSLIYLRSAVFNRSLYNFGFALRHRPKKTIERTMNQLESLFEKVK